MDAKNELKSLLQYGIYKLDNNLSTMEEIQSLTKVLQENLELSGTIEDFSKFFGKPEVTVRTTIHKKLIAKPKRRVMYPFLKFLKVVPDKWLNSK